MARKDRKDSEVQLSPNARALGVAFDHSDEDADNLVPGDLEIVVKTGEKGDTAEVKVDGKDLPKNQVRDDVNSAVRALENAVRRSLTTGPEPDLGRAPWEEGDKKSK